MPSDAALGQGYGEAASEDYVEEEAGQRETARHALTRIERWLPGAGAPGPPRLLDLGCWVGFLLAEARERGWEGIGVEPSAFASTYARERLGLDVRREELLHVDLPASAFDVAILGDVIEHLPRPGEALDRLATLLRTGGPRLAWLALPDAGSRVARAMGARWWSVLPTHVQYFTRRSLITLLRRHGWEVLEVTTAPKAFTVGYYLERTGGYSPPVARALVRAARAAGVADRIWAPDFRDRMQVVARRPDGPRPPRRAALRVRARTSARVGVPDRGCPGSHDSAVDTGCIDKESGGSGRHETVSQPRSCSWTDP
ncbi:MAG: class I SAM-dependent methyltransferase [Solirubrobacteraceae bacterium MAG38_C4-C5]|nr:class I SAM-dependent methyltransferase [Candidatus Siliceabacter maunaloa]